MSDAPCQCTMTDAWRCAVDRNLRTVACPCECHGPATSEAVTPTRRPYTPDTGAEAITQVIDAAAEADMQKMKTLHKEVRDLIDRQAEVTSRLEAYAKTLNNTIKRAEDMLFRRPTQQPTTFQKPKRK